MNRYQPSKSLPKIISFEGLKEELDDTNTNFRMKKTAKSLPIFVVRIDNFSLSQLLKEIAMREYEIKTIKNEQIKIYCSSCPCTSVWISVTQLSVPVSHPMSI
jgi:hypothetical protein